MLCVRQPLGAPRFPGGRCAPPYARIGSARFALNRRHRLDFGVPLASSVPAGFSSDDEQNPYEVLGVNPLESFDRVKTVYNRKRKEAETNGDETTAARLERAYDKIMMSQLNKRKKGVTFGEVKVSKNIKYADRVPLLPWGPKRAQSSKRDMLINAGISIAMPLWIFVAQGVADWKPLQILIFVYVFQLFNKIKSYEPPESPIVYDEEEHNQRVNKSGLRLLRTFGFVFGCIAIASVTFTGILNLIEFTGNAIPLWFYNSQETFVTFVSSVLLFFVASFYR